LATHIQVEKLDPPGHGYKGKIPATSTLDYVGQQWGDGTYSFTVVNGRGETLKKKEGVTVSVGVSPNNAVANRPKETNSGSSTASELGGLLSNLIEKLDRDRTRDDDQTKSLISQARELAKQHAEMVIQTSKDSASRDHDYHKSQLASQEGLFKTLLSQVQDGSKILMTQLQQIHTQQQQWQDQSFKQTFALIMGIHKQEKEMMREQMAFLEDHQGGDSDEPEWMKALTMGVSGIKELRMLAANATDMGRKRALLKKVRLMKSAQKSDPKTTENPNENQRKIDTRPTVMRRRKPLPIRDEQSGKFRSGEDTAIEAPETPEGDLG
jgi:hypothetical protein